MAKCDELWAMADDVESRCGYPTVAEALRDAAYTIWELRDRAQVLQAENVQLQELLVEVLHELDKVEENVSHGWFWEAARELGVEVEE